jgi:hypothetical protein
MQKQISITITNESLEYMQENLFKSLSNTLNWFVLNHQEKFNSIKPVKIVASKANAKVLRISEQAKEYIKSNKLANSMSYTIDCIIKNAIDNKLSPFS